MRSSVRPLAAATAYLALAAHLFGLLHMVAIRHATCPSHGETVHGTPVAQSLQPAANASVASMPVDGRTVVDEHCAIVALLSAAMAGLSPDGSARISPPQDQRLVPAAAPSGAAVQLPLLSLAPKTSPPAVRA